MKHDHAIEPRTSDAIRRFVDRASHDFDIADAILFGSRARGDFHAESDADLAVVLRGGPSDRVKAVGALADMAFDVLLETGVLISPLPLTELEIEEPAAFGNPALVEAIRREGVRL